MKTIVIGDVHGRSLWKQIVNQENADRVIFIGDYFDSFDIKCENQITNFLDIIEYKKSSGKEVIMLVGNHDHHYFPEIGDTGTSGYQAIGRLQIGPVIDANREHLQMAYKMDDFLFSHAGVSSEWMDDNIVGWDVDNMVGRINELFHYQPNKFTFRSFKQYSNERTILSDGHGSNTYQTPIWIRPKALMNVNYNTLRTQVIQIVGHTQVKKLDLVGSQKSAGGRYYLIDCQDSTGEYLVIQDGELSVGTTR